jgi:hypothetical protein
MIMTEFSSLTFICAVSVTEMSFSSGKKVKGLCSSYLQNLVPNQSTCRAFVRPSTFKLPKSLSTPIIMIGTATCSRLKIVYIVLQLLLSKTSIDQ